MRAKSNTSVAPHLVKTKIYTTQVTNINKVSSFSSLHKAIGIGMPSSCSISLLNKTAIANYNLGPISSPPAFHHCNGSVRELAPPSWSARFVMIFSTPPDVLVSSEL